MNKSLPLAAALLFAGFLNPLAPVLLQEAAASTGTSTAGHVLVSLGNPCRAWGDPGGLAANPAARQLFYASVNNTTVFRLTHTAGFATITCAWYTWAAGQGQGWTSLAHDPVRNVLWGARQGTSEVWRIPLPACAAGATCPVTPVKWLTAPGPDAGALAVQGSDLVVGARDGGVAHRYAGAAALAIPPAAPVPATFALTALPGAGLRGLANVQGALWVLDPGNRVLTHTPSGLGAVDRFWAHALYHDGFHQHYDLPVAGITDLAFDPVAFGPKGAAWVTQPGIDRFEKCISGCLPAPCEEYGQNEAGQYCKRYGPDPDGPPSYIIITNPIPLLQAHEAPANLRCAGPDFVCPCPPPEPFVVATGPQATWHLRGEVVDPTQTLAFPVFYGAPARFSAAVQGIAALPTLVLYIDGKFEHSVEADAIAFTADATHPMWTQRGMHTWHAMGVDAATGCVLGGPLMRFWVEDPVLRTHAQALRIEGNLPAHLVAQTPAMHPADDLSGAESGLVLDRTNPAPLAVDAELLGAHAEHGLLQGPDRFIARASASIERVALGVDLAGLCALATGNDPACVPLPSVQRSLEGMRDSVLVEAWPLSGYWDTLRDFQLHNNPALTTTCQDLQGLPGFSWRSGPGCQVTVNQHLTVEYNIETIRNGPTWMERSFVPLRIVVDNGALLGEVVVGEVYAGISLSGAHRLLGPPGVMTGEGDYQFPGDAPASGGPLLSPGAHHGFFEGADTVDSFRFTASQGDEVRLVVAPGHRAQLTLEPLPTPPAALAQLRELRVTLYDSTGATVATAATTAANLPQVFATVAPATGDFRVVVERLDPGELRATYGVALQVNAPVV